MKCHVNAAAMLALALTGCGDTLHREQIDRGTEYCAKHGGVVWITSGGWSGTTAGCVDGYVVTRDVDRTKP